MGHEASGYIPEDEASELTGFSRHHIYQLAEQGRIRAFQPSDGPQHGTWLVHKDDLLAYKEAVERPRETYDPRESTDAEDETNGET